MRVAVVILGAMALGVVLYFSGFFEGVVSGFEGHPGLPSCTSSHGQSDAKHAIEASPLAKTSGIAVIAMIEVKTISITAKKVECTATALLNNTQKADMSYSFSNDPPLEGGQYYIKAVLDTGSFRP